MGFPTMWYVRPARLRSACAYAQSDQSLCLSLEHSMIVKLLTEHHLEFLSLKRGCRGSSESTHVKIPPCWKSHALAHLPLFCIIERKIVSEYDQEIPQSQTADNLVALRGRAAQPSGDTRKTN